MSKLDDIRKVFMQPPAERRNPYAPVTSIDFDVVTGIRGERCLGCDARSGHFRRCKFLDDVAPHPGSISGDGNIEARHQAFRERQRQVDLAMRSEIDHRFQGLAHHWKGQKVGMDFGRRMENDIGAMFRDLARDIPDLSELLNVTAECCFNADERNFRVHFKGTTQDSDALVKEYLSRDLFKET